MNILHIDKKLCRARSLLQERSNVQASLHTLYCVRSPTTSWSPIMTWPPASNVRPLPQPFASNK